MTRDKPMTCSVCGFVHTTYETTTVRGCPHGYCECLKCGALIDCAKGKPKEWQDNELPARHRGMKHDMDFNPMRW